MELEIRYKKQKIIKAEDVAIKDEVIDQDVEEKETRDWSSLPDPMLLLILSFFATLQDFFVFRRICRNWRIAAIPSRHTMALQSPLILLTRRIGFFRTYSRCFFDIVNNRPYMITPPAGHIIGYFHGQLVVFRYAGIRYNPRIRLYNIFTGVETKVPEGRGLSNIRPYRFLLSAPPSSPDCIAILQSRQASSIYYWRIGENKWRRLSYNNVIDMIFFDKKLYVLTSNYRLGVFDLLSQYHPKIKLLKVENGFDLEVIDNYSPWCLVESGGDLILICKRYQFLKWNFEGDEGWVRVSTFGERSVFIGEKGFAGSLTLSRTSGFLRNCLYHVHSRNNSWMSYLIEGRQGNFCYPNGIEVNQGEDIPLWIFPSLC